MRPIFQVSATTIETVHHAVQALQESVTAAAKRYRRRVVEKLPDQKGFVVLERRWVVERTFGWISRWGGLHRERAGRRDVATGRLACGASLIAANARNNPA